MIARWLRRWWPRAAAKAPRPDAAEHARWVNWLRVVAVIQQHAVPSHPHDCFCVCGIPRADLERFRDQLELVAWELQQEEQQRRRGQ